MALKISLALASEDDVDSTEDAGEDAGEAKPDRRKDRVRPVSDRVMRFVREYVRDRDGTAAAARAGFPRRTAQYWAASTLRRPEVQEAIYDELARRAAENGPSAARIVAEVTRLAFSDPGRIARWSPDGIELIHSVDLTDDDRVAVKRLSLGPPRGEGKRAQRFEMHDKLAALELLARLTGMLPRDKHASRIATTRERRDANTILRERLMRIARAGETKEEK